MKKQIEIMPAEIVDETTGEVLNTAEMEKRLIFFEQQIALNLFQVATALKSIRDEKLYLVRYKTMKEYTETHLSMSERNMKRYLQIADAFNEKSLKKFKDTPMKMLLEISRDDELIEEANDPESEPDDVVKKAREQEKKKLQKKLDKNQELIEGQDALLTDLRDKVQNKDTEIDKLKSTIQSLIGKKDVDPSRVVFITQKKEAMGIVDESTVQILDSLGTLNTIPHDLLDAELSGKLSQSIAAVEAGVRRLRDFYSSYVVTPLDSAGLVPED